jgi:hypothetical protein
MRAPINQTTIEGIEGRKTHTNDTIASITQQQKY